MGISVETIRQYMYSAQAYEKASILCDSGKVQIDRSGSFWKGEAGIKGSVDGFRCSLSISKGDVEAYGCVCDDFKIKRGMCCHIGALALAYIKKTELGNQGVVYTSSQAKKIVSMYIKKAERGNYADDRITDLELSWRIEADKDYLEIEYFISKAKRKIQLKNLYQFEELFAENECFEYGSNFKVIHEMNVFKEADRPMLEFLLSHIRNVKLRSAVLGNQACDVYIKDNKKLILVGKEVDEFMGICYNCRKSIAFKNKNTFSLNEKNLVLIKDNPEVNINLKPIANQGYQVIISGMEYVFRGENRLYIMDAFNVYIASEEYSLGIGEFMMEAVNAEYDNKIKAYKLAINKKDMPAFCNLVIAGIGRYCSIHQQDMNIEEFAPWQLNVTFDVEISGTELSCRVKCSYREEDFDLFKGTSNILGICRDYNKESRLKNALLKYFPEGELHGSLKTNNYKHVFEFLKNGIKELERYGEVNLSKSVLDYQIIDSMKINANVSMDGGWLKLDIDAGEYSKNELEELLDAYKRKEKYIKLGQDRLIKLDDNGLELLAQMAYDLDFSATDIINHQVFIPRYRALYIDGRLREGDLAAYDKDAAFKALVRVIKQVEDSEFMIPEELEDTLRAYQKYGFRWLRTLDVCGFGGILADDMGLGKTLQIITLFLDEKLSVSRNIPSLIIAPASLIYNWENEIKKFAPQLKSVSVVGTKAARRQIMANYSEYDVIITSYELLKRDIDLYSDITFRFQVIDEAQNIKNSQTANAKCVKQIKAQTRFALTGTPIENRLSELWSIFDYLMPGFLYSYGKFKEKFEKPIISNNEIGAMKGLTRIIGPFVLRRMKKDVLKELPEKQEFDIYTKLEGKQHRLYLANVLKLREFIENTEDEGFGKSKMKILSELMRLRQLCCDPSLCYNDYDGESAKLNMCMDMVKNGISAGHKILIFSQFTSMLEIIGKRFDEENISYFTLKGSTTKENRMKMVESFNEDDTNVFLISLKAGGVGLNLTGADMVIHYDPWWNAAVENQASDRAHRIGQDKIVSVYKLISKGTIEERIRELQKRKAALADNIINGSSKSLSSLSKQDLLGILNLE